MAELELLSYREPSSRAMTGLGERRTSCLTGLEAEKGV